MRMSRATKEISVGAVVSLGMIIFAFAVMAISKESRLFTKKVAYWTRFENTGGLSVGSPVRLVGVQIGSISEIEFPQDITDTKIKVSFSVDQDYAIRIRAGTQALLKSLTYLSQDKYIELTPGDPDKAALPPDGFIEPGESVWEQMTQQSQSIADDVKEITASLRDLLVAINRGGGIVQEMIHNPEFGRQGVSNMEGSLASLRRLLEGVEKGKGLAGGLLTDEAFRKKQLEAIDGTLAHLKSVTEKLDSDKGLVAQLTSPDGQGAKAMEDLRSASASLRQTADNISKGKGLVGRLMNDETYADTLLKKIDAVAGHADSILRKVDSGKGTLGGIVNDPEVYEGLKDVVKGIQKSRVGKGLIRHYGKKGAKDRGSEEQEGEGGEEPGPDKTPAPSETPKSAP
ncbi:MAG TPA: MlaD family protein [Candidatus Polarisedimenticolia bacterium]|nr:MlaD family protein [Candidatus Polarisedimenticolia bacterium]